jgi:hypothetical protein
MVPIPAAIMKVMGHSDLQMTTQYVSFVKLRWSKHYQISL